MSQRLALRDLEQIAIVTAEPPRTRVERNFGLPTALYATTVGLYLAFLGVMSAAFLNPELAIPMVIFALFIVAAFGTPALWARMKPDHADRALNLGEFARGGIDTATGRLTAREASVQVLILPALILAWGLSVAVIAATV